MSRRPVKTGILLNRTVIENLGPYCKPTMRRNLVSVVTLQPFETMEQQALELSNASHYGLAATIWTQDISKANYGYALIGNSVVNCWLVRDLRTPFGGMKNSGVEQKAAGKPCGA